MAIKYSISFSGKFKQILIAVCLNLGHVLIGYSLMWTAPVIPKLQDPTQTPLTEVISIRKATWIASSFVCGCLIGSPATAILPNKIGRKLCLVIGGLALLSGFIIITCAKYYAMILTGRVITAVGSSMVAVVNLVYIGEIMSPKIRGLVLTLTGVSHSFGSLLVNATAPFISYTAFGLIFICLCVIHIVGCTYIPESPMFYLIQGNNDKAKAVLRELRDGKNVDKEIDSMYNTTNQDKKISSIKKLLTNKSSRKAFVLTVSIYVFQECSGILAFSWFSTTIFQYAASSIDSNIATIILNLTQFLTAMIAPTFVERLGRRVLLMISLLGCSVCMLVIGTYFYLDSSNHSWIVNARWLPLPVMLIAYCSYGVGLNIIPNTLIGELYSNDVRSLGSSLSLNIGWLLGAITVTVFGYMVEEMGAYSMFWMFSMINLIGFIFTYHFIPETKGMTLREIEELLEN